MRGSGAHDRQAWTGVAAMLLMGVLAAQAGVSGTASQEQVTVLQGILRYQHVDDVAEPRFETLLEMPGGRTVVLKGPGADPTTAGPGTPVSVSGRISATGLAMEVDSYAQTALSTSSLGNNFGEQRTIAIMANFRNDNSQPKTEKDVRDVIEGSGDKIVREYSFEQAWIKLDVTGWHTTTIDSTCDQNAILQPAIAAADPTVDFKPYTRITILFPGSCSYAGVATVGSRTINTQDGTITASVLWMPSAGWRASVWVHEHGHNFGVWHANSLSCGGKSFGEVGTAGCTTQDYGDPWESMGNKATAHYDTSHKREIGWLWANRSVTATKGVFDLEPVEKMSSTLQEVVVPYDGSNYYTIEKRAPIGQDAGETGNLYNGAVIHFAPWKSSTGDSHIIDTTFTTSSLTDAALEGGKTYTDTLKNLEITTISSNSTHLRVRVGPDTGDSTPPTVRIVYPVDQGGAGGTSITINGTAGDNSGVSEVQVSVNGAAFAKATGTSAWSAPGTMKAGANGICARAFDASGNMAQHCVTAWLDVNPPTVAITSPADGSIANSSGVTFTGTAQDDVRLDKVETQVNGGQWTVATGLSSWSSPLTLPGGQNTVCARATDTAAKLSQLSCIRVGVDAAPPAVAILSPKDGGAVSQAQATVSGNSSDDMEVEKVEVQVGAGPWSAATGTTSWSASVTLSSGANRICARATDKAGKAATSQCPTVTLDQTPPTVKITSPADGSTVPAEALMVSGTAADDFKVERVEVQVGGGSWSLATGTASWSATVNLPSQGSNRICARAVDVAGNAGSGSDCVNVEAQAPRVLKEVRIAPSSADVAFSGTQQFTAEALDTEGKPLPHDAVNWSWVVIEGRGAVDKDGLFAAANSTGISKVRVTARFGGLTKDAVAEVRVGGAGGGGSGGGASSVLGFITSPLFLIVLLLLAALVAAAAVASRRRKKKRPQTWYDESGQGEHLYR